MEKLLDTPESKWIPLLKIGEFRYRDLLTGKSIMVVFDPYSAVSVGQNWVIREEGYKDRNTSGMELTGRECDVRVVEISKGWVGFASGYLIVRVEVMAQRVGAYGAN